MAKGIGNKIKRKDALVKSIVTALEYKTIDECKRILLFIAEMDKRDIRPYENAKK